MKKKGIIVAVFFAVIMTTSLAAGVMLNRSPSVEEEDVGITKTGTPADNFPDAQREQFCGTSDPKSTDFVKEYSIPTACTNPLAIVSDYDGNVWFAETNTGRIAKFEPKTESFSEFENPAWPKGGRSMMWGIDYSPDGSIWFTDEAYDSIWRFSPETQKYQRLSYPSDGNSLPQRLQVQGSQVIVNDFTGNKITFLDPTQSSKDLNYVSLPSPQENSVTADFTVDKNNNIWYTNWIFQDSGVLVKYDQPGFQKSVADTGNYSRPLFDFIDIFELPPELSTPNGTVATKDGKIWLADTSSSYFFSFEQNTKQFTQYVTSEPQLMTYGNFTGIIKSPISRPYWIDVDSYDRLVFNEQTSNSIAVMDPKDESLIEYSIPSRNPNWGDCNDAPNCGVAQVFDFTIEGDRIWFTEWVENNIGVVDTSIKLPLNVKSEQKEISIKSGESADLNFVIQSQSESSISDVSPIFSKTNQLLNISSSAPKKITLNPNESMTVDITISADKNIMPGTYKILLGAQMPDVSISEFITLTIQP